MVYTMLHIWYSSLLKFIFYQRNSTNQMSCISPNPVPSHNFTPLQLASSVPSSSHCKNIGWIICFNMVSLIASIAFSLLRGAFTGLYNAIALPRLCASALAPQMASWPYAQSWHRLHDMQCHESSGGMCQCQGVDVLEVTGAQCLRFNFWKWLAW